MDGLQQIVDLDDGFESPPLAMSSGSSLAQYLYDDVLYNIFLFGLPSNVGLYPEGAFILNVSQVCRSWRGVTASNPNLWAEVTWDPLEGDEASLEIPRLEWATLLFRDFLTRSQDSPLSINIQSSSPASPSFSSFESIVVSILDMAVQRRLRHFSLYCVAPDLSPTSAYMVIDAPQLETLDIDIAESNSFGGELYVDISQSPRLRTLALTGQVRLSKNYMRSAPLRLLQSMILRTASTAANWWMQSDTFLESLRRLPCLDMISFDIQIESIRADGLQKPQLSVTRAENLVTMHLRFNQSPISTANDLFKHLDLPKLNTLILDYNFSPIHLFIPQHTWLDVNCLRTLEDLTICYGFTEAMMDDLARDEEIVSLLHLTPSLLHLTIRDVPLSGRVFSALALTPDPSYESSDSPAVCPLLESISIENESRSFGRFPIPPSAVVRTNNDGHRVQMSIPSVRQKAPSPK